jgi:mono/diheme cytochrome c family protein
LEEQIAMKRIAVLASSVVIALGAVAAPAADDGKSLYGSKCAMCHGQDGVPKKSAEGSKAFGSKEFKASANEASILAAIQKGKEKMKPVKGVSDDQAKQIAAYILSMGSAK